MADKTDLEGTGSRKKQVPSSTIEVIDFTRPLFGQSKSLIVSNFSMYITEEDIVHLFERFGLIFSVQSNYGQMGNTKILEYCFVNYYSVMAAENAKLTLHQRHR